MATPIPAGHIEEIGALVGFRVVTDSVRAEADLWEAQHGVMMYLSSQADALRPDNMGLYTVFAPVYEQLAVTVAMRCGEGAQAMLEVGDRLRRVAKIYDDGEAFRQSVMDKLHPAKRGGDPR